MKTRYDIATVSYDTVDDLVDTDPITLRDLAWAAITEAREVGRDLATNEGSEDARLTIAEATIARLTGPEARERLARHLYLEERDDEWAAREWDFGGSQHVNKERWLARADKLIAVLEGKAS